MRGERGMGEREGGIIIWERDQREGRENKVLSNKHIMQDW